MGNAKKKIVVVLSRVPYPLEKGDKLRAYYQIKELSKTYSVSLCCLTEEKISKPAKKELEKITDEFHVFKLKKWLIYWNVFKTTFSQKPFQVGYFFQHKIKKEITNCIRSFEPDFIYCQLIRAAEYVKDIYDFPKTIDYMDAFSKGMLRRADISKGLKRYLLKLEGERLKRYENRIFDYFDNHIIISEQDKKYITHSKNDTIQVVENGIDDSFFNYTSLSPKTYDLVFVGNLSYAPNVECCHYIIDYIFPELIKRLPSAKILLAGVTPHASIVSKVEGIENITVSGWLRDIREGYVSGKLFVAPLFIGTGLQNKLLEAMALGVPCITTSLANNALKAKPDEAILIANSTFEFVDSIMNLLENESKYNDLSTAASQFVKHQFNWRESTGKIKF